MTTDRIPADWVFDDIHDTMDRGCGDFLLDLKQRIDASPPGFRLVVATRDAGSPLEVPSWCRLTGHRLEASAHPFYLIVARS